MPIKELIKGNRLDDILVGGEAGYRLHTGPRGTETDDRSFCGDSRVLAFYKKDYNNLTKSPQGVCDDNGWDAWLLTHEVPDGPATGGSVSVGYPIEQAKEPPAKRSAKKEPVASEELKPAKKRNSSTGKKSRKKS